MQVTFDHDQDLGGNPIPLNDRIGQARRELEEQDRFAIAQAVSSIDTSELTTAQQRIKGLQAQIARTTANFDGWTAQRKILELNGSPVAEADAALERLGTELDALEAELPRLQSDVAGHEVRIRREAQAAGARIVGERASSLQSERRRILDDIAADISARLDELFAVELAIAARRHVRIDQEAESWAVETLKQGAQS